MDLGTWKEKTIKNQLTTALPRRGSLPKELSQVAIDGVELPGLVVV